MHGIYTREIEICIPPKNPAQFILYYPKINPFGQQILVSNVVYIDLGRPIFTTTLDPFPMLECC